MNDLPKITIGILTLSDRASRGEYEDAPPEAILRIGWQIRWISSTG